MPVQDKSAREALQTFIGGKGDVMLAYEGEAINARQKDQPVDYVVPNDTILIENPIAVGIEIQERPRPAPSSTSSARRRPRSCARRAQLPAGQPGRPPPASTSPSRRPVHHQDLGGWSGVNKKFFDKDAGIVAEIERKVGVSVGS